MVKNRGGENGMIFPGGEMGSPVFDTENFWENFCGLRSQISGEFSNLLENFDSKLLENKQVFFRRLGRGLRSR